MWSGARKRVLLKLFVLLLFAVFVCVPALTFLCLQHDVLCWLHSRAAPDIQVECMAHT